MLVVVVAALGTSVGIAAAGATRAEDLPVKEVTVFKDGLGYDSARLIESVRSQVGTR